MGLWSEQMSDSDGAFDTPITVTRTYNNTFTAPGVTLTFDTYNNTYADMVNVKWYRDNTLLYDNDYTPNSSVYFCEQNVVAYNKIVITFTHMNKASRFLKLFKIDDGIIREFYKDEILGLTINEGISDTGESLTINTMNLNILSKSSIKIIFQRVQALKVYNDIKMQAQYEINKTIVKGTIISIAKTYVLASFDGNVGICHISNVSDYLVRSLNNFFTLGEQYDFLVIGDDGYGQINLSFKAIHPKFLKQHRDVIPTPSGFKNLKEDLDRRLKKL